jgi:hypothetical protein
VSERIAAGGVRITREQAHDLLAYPELLARMVDVLTQQIEHTVAQGNGTPEEFITFAIYGETVYLTGEEPE